MLVNKNIFAKIVDIIALIKWKNMVKNISIEYQNKYKYIHNMIEMGVNNCKCSAPSSFHAYNYRNELFDNYDTQGNSDLYKNVQKKCKKCDRINYAYKKISKIPKKYYYSSGLNHPNGYKN